MQFAQILSRDIFIVLQLVIITNAEIHSTNAVTTTRGHSENEASSTVTEQSQVDTSSARTTYRITSTVDITTEQTTQPSANELTSTSVSDGESFDSDLIWNCLTIVYDLGAYTEQIAMVYM